VMAHRLTLWHFFFFFFLLASNRSQRVEFFALFSFLWENK
jgi:hypothetical protein